ncbi:hypothetical protein DFH06DRAFT_1151345 [Mycena polygramma]|nr:hypothetical protein DFH06DRAFT_1151345 [Mycena polygramma]
MTVMVKNGKGKGGAVIWLWCLGALISARVAPLYCALSASSIATLFPGLFWAPLVEIQMTLHRTYAWWPPRNVRPSRKFSRHDNMANPCATCVVKNREESSRFFHRPKCGENSSHPIRLHAVAPGIQAVRRCEEEHDLVQETRHISELVDGQLPVACSVPLHRARRRGDLPQYACALKQLWTPENLNKLFEVEKIISIFAGDRDVTVPMISSTPFTLSTGFTNSISLKWSLGQEECQWVIVTASVAAVRFGPVQPQIFRTSNRTIGSVQPTL